MASTSVIKATTSLDSNPVKVSFHFDNGKVSIWDIGQVAEFVFSEGVTIFRLQKKTQNSSLQLSLHDYVGGASECPLSTCVCPGCSGSLLPSKEIHAMIYGLSGPQEVILQTKQCSARACRTHYGYNYLWKDGVLTPGHVPHRPGLVCLQQGRFHHRIPQVPRRAPFPRTSRNACHGIRIQCSVL